jgi:hypothetical protein
VDGYGDALRSNFKIENFEYFRNFKILQWMCKKKSGIKISHIFFKKYTTSEFFFEISKSSKFIKFLY